MNEIQRRREVWTRQDWIATLALCVVFPPIGLVALLRWFLGEKVWYV
jgi:hypothetical protein